MDSRKRRIISSAAVLFTVGGLALKNVFSINVSRDQAPGDLLRSETSLLLNEPDGLLAEKDARKIIKNAQFLIVKLHKVGRNEWLEKIAQEFGAPAPYLRSTNNLEDPGLRPQQEMVVYNKRGMVHVAKSGEPVESVIKFYERLGAKKEKILAGNAWDEISEIKEGILCLKEGAALWIPDARKSFPVFFRPVAWSRISSSFGFRRHPLLKMRRFHDGYDLVAPYGSSVYASEGGTVLFAGWKGGYGNMVEIRHRNTTTRYGHLSALYVQTGQEVKKKHLIGRVGSSGLSTGPHLHFEVRRNSDGKLQNPRKYLF